MVRKKQLAAKSISANAEEPTSSMPIRSPARPGDSNEPPLEHDAQAVEFTVERMEPGKQEKKMTSLEEELESERGESLLTPLPTERDTK